LAGVVSIRTVAASQVSSLAGVREAASVQPQPLIERQEPDPRSVLVKAMRTSA
jgi:hypothetical protein